MYVCLCVRMHGHVPMEGMGDAVRALMSILSWCCRLSGQRYRTLHISGSFSPCGRETNTVFLVFLSPYRVTYILKGI